MGQSRRSSRRLIARAIAVVAVTDAAYRLFVRDAVRRALGISTRTA